MAQNIIVLGNGFDLSLGLPTSWKDFLQSKEFEDLYKVERSSLLISSISKEAELENWVDVENYLKVVLKNLIENYPKGEKYFQDNYYQLSRAIKDFINRANRRYSFGNENLAYEVLQNNYYKHGRTLILDFNYTNTTEMILNQMGVDKQDIIYSLKKVHGTVSNDDIIFGIEDGYELPNNFSYLRKSAKKNFKPFKLDEHLDIGNTIVTPGSGILKVTIFGHSLGETDSYYFTNFFQNAHTNYNRKKIPNDIYLDLWYYGDDSYHDLTTQMSRLTKGNMAEFKNVVNVNYQDSSI